MYGLACRPATGSGLARQPGVFGFLVLFALLPGISYGGAPRGPSSRLSLNFFASNPSPAVAGEDFTLLFSWSTMPDTATIRVFAPSGKLALGKVLRGNAELSFPAAAYMKHLKERGTYKVVVQAKKGGNADYTTTLAFDLVEPWGRRGRFTLGLPDKKAICTGQFVCIAMRGLIEPKMPIAAWIVSDRGKVHDIGPKLAGRVGQIVFRFDTRGHLRNPPEQGMYRFKVTTKMGNRTYQTQYSRPFTYFAPKETLREVMLDGKTYALQMDEKDPTQLRYYIKGPKGPQTCNEPMNRRLRMLAHFKRVTGEALRQVSPYLKHTKRSYAPFVFSVKPAVLANYQPAHLVWADESAAGRLGLTRVVILDDLGQAISDESFARRLFRAAGVRYWLEIAGTSNLSINSKDVKYVRSMIKNPAIHAVFIAQAAKSLLNSPEARYKALFEGMILADSDSVLLTAGQRKALARVLASGGKVDDALTAIAKVARNLPTGYVRQLDENWLLVRRGEQWRWVARKDVPNVGLAIGLAEVFVELNHHQWVLRSRAEMLRRAGPEILQRTPLGNRTAMGAGLKQALSWSQHAYKSGMWNAIDKLIEVAKKEGIGAAKGLAAKMVSGATPYLLAFEVPNVLFNMDGMYESNQKAQCAADVLAAAIFAVRSAVVRAKRSEKIEDWRRVDAIYLLANLAKERFHSHSAIMLESSGMGRPAGDLLTGGQTSNWIKGQRTALKAVRAAVARWEGGNGVESCVRLLAPKDKTSQKGLK